MKLKRRPMGHKNSAQSLCRMLSKVLKGLLWRNLFSYLDDILLVSQTDDEHLELLGLRSFINFVLYKCFYSVDTLQLLITVLPISS